MKQMEELSLEFIHSVFLKCLKEKPEASLLEVEGAVYRILRQGLDFYENTNREQTLPSSKSKSQEGIGGESSEIQGNGIQRRTSEVPKGFRYQQGSSSSGDTKKRRSKKKK